MRRQLKYDFSSLEDIFYEALEATKMSDRHIRNIKRELNLFFRDASCEQVYYTDNGDKMLFGIKVYAKLDADNIYEYLMGTEDIILSNYSLEYDSHLFNPTLGLTPMEMVALTLHEVGHVVNDSTPVANARKYLDEYLAKNNDSMRVTSSYHYREILAYALKDFISKQGSVFYASSVDEILADDFVRSYGYGEHLESAMNKILTKHSSLYSGTDVDIFSVFMWTLGLYKHMGTRRIGAIRTMNKAIALTGSRIEKAEMSNVINRVKRVDDSALMEASSLKSKFNRKMREFRYNTIRGIEDDYFELNMRVKNVEDEEEALYLMRQLNTRISILDDHVNSEDIEQNEVIRWNESLDKFRTLRTKLADTTTYKNKSYGLFVAYPEIKDSNY